MLFIGKSLSFALACKPLRNYIYKNLSVIHVGQPDREWHAIENMFSFFFDSISFIGVNGLPCTDSSSILQRINWPDQSIFSATEPLHAASVSTVKVIDLFLADKAFDHLLFYF